MQSRKSNKKAPQAAKSFWSAYPVTKEEEMDLFRVIIAILLPPVGVFMQVGFGGDFWLNILLTLLGYVPGLVHAIWVIAKK